jgi:hypothetical protein
VFTFGGEPSSPSPSGSFVPIGIKCICEICTCGCVVRVRFCRCYCHCMHGLVGASGVRVLISCWADCYATRACSNHHCPMHPKGPSAPFEGAIRCIATCLCLSLCVCLVSVFVVCVSMFVSVSVCMYCAHGRWVP